MIDFRSDTVTKPSRDMREAMAQAVVGDDVYGEDETVNLLEEKIASMLGKEAAIFAPSGTQSNLLALMSHCQRGDEYIVGQMAHTYKYEGGGAAVLGSIQPQPLDFEDDGTLDLAKVRAFIKPDDYHFARTALLCLENTQAGKVIPVEYIQQAAAVAVEHGLGFHLDGARLFNAAVKLGISPQKIASPFDTVSVCFSKGLGAPVGSALAGSARLISSARKWRKMLGGGMRQAGIIAAACLFALEHNIPGLARDHEHADRLARGLSGLKNIQVLPHSAKTNMVFIEIKQELKGVQEFMRQRGITVPAGNTMRLVTHLDITGSDIDRTIEAFSDFDGTN